MPKIFSFLSQPAPHRAVALSLSAAVFLFACGQKGPLYLPTDEIPAPQVENKTPTLAPAQKGRITTSLVSLETLTVTGKLAQLNQANPQSWRALLSEPTRNGNRLRYVVFNGDILDKTVPLTVLVGAVQNNTIQTNQQSQIVAGTYLRVRSLETGVKHVPALMATAEHYLAQTPSVKRTSVSDFLIESDKNIDLFLSVEQR